MKLKQLLLPLILASGMLSGCGSITNSVDNSLVDRSPIILEKENEEIYPIIDWDEKDYVCTGGSYGGYLIELGMGRLLSIGNTYEMVFKSSHGTDKSITIKTTNEKVASITLDKENSDVFYVNAHAYGDIILTIFNADDMLVYRNIVRVRKPASVVNLYKAMFDVDRYATPSFYEAWLGNWELSFVEYQERSLAVLKGGDDYEADVSFVFTCDLDVIIYDRDVYSLQVTMVSSTSSYTVLGTIQIARCLDCLYVYDNYGYLVTALVAIGL